MSGEQGLWLRALRQGAQARACLVCLPHAGGSASFFRPWLAHLPGDIDLLAVQYPGREERFNEPHITRLTALAEPIAQALLALPARTLMLFGHSMGAAIAYEVGLRLEAAGRGAAHVFVSAHPPPHRLPPSDLHRQEDSVLIADILRQDAGAASLWADSQLRKLFLPTLRSDYQAIETWRPEQLRALASPIDVLLARDDQEVSLEQAQAWADLTRHTPDICQFDGDHFYLKQQPRPVIRHLLQRFAHHHGASA
ncbi:thioesterase II family protein [Pseudomonas fluorescens]|uniref:Thioesterase n=1 Tax=Pseudomonas fluorescens TaxID=294 RepID=A0A944DME9_PSEFL|nr:alpha/beta fold hydrolase [Pseudomonas fluorescens]MBT2297493.1 thioesterase [Pseudomonas fluorescens]MBT2305691.1 thioesterase [Pseudomonas fluorescens]MBT2314286.1 thioesterase [Pseudomonas fluorescens]MBT2319222.1 thioesterase [Pseudomonas fluorescens]MBT2328505.1 thioesterase [Pseudomonas fluorescens]